MTVDVAVPTFHIIDVNEVSKHRCRPVNTVTLSDSGHCRSQSLVGNPGESLHEPLQEYLGVLPGVSASSEIKHFILLMHCSTVIMSYVILLLGLHYTNCFVSMP